MPTAEAIPQPFTNLQLELLKIYARTVDEKDLLEIKRLLGPFSARYRISYGKRCRFLYLRIAKIESFYKNTGHKSP